jgi:hypothetical protein
VGLQRGGPGARHLRDRRPAHHLHITATSYLLTIDDFTSTEGAENGVRTVCGGKASAPHGQVVLTTTSSEQEEIGEAPLPSGVCPDLFRVTVSGSEVDLTDTSGNSWRFLKR